MSSLGFPGSAYREYTHRATAPPHIFLTLDGCSACTCPGEEHPGPDNSKERGVPEIDILEAEKDKEEGGVGQVASQSAQFAPFTHDYLFNNDTTDAWTIYDPSITRENDYRGSAM